MGVPDTRTEDLIAAARRERWTSLDLSDLGLSVLPPEVLDLRDLEQLNLWDNRLTHLPEAIGRLNRLTGLYLGGNQLTELPEAIGALGELTNLDAAGNRLTTVPDSIGRLVRLVSLDVSGNPIRRLPPSVARLTALETLEVDTDGLEPPLAAAIGSGPDAVRSHLAAAPSARAPAHVPGAARAAYSAPVRDPARSAAPLRPVELSFLLVIAAALALLVGLWRGLLFVYLSMVCSVVAWVVLRWRGPRRPGSRRR